MNSGRSYGNSDTKTVYKCETLESKAQLNFKCSPANKMKPNQTLTKLNKMKAIIEAAIVARVERGSGDEVAEIRRLACALDLIHQEMSNINRFRSTVQMDQLNGPPLSRREQNRFRDAVARAARGAPQSLDCIATPGQQASEMGTAGPLEGPSGLQSHQLQEAIQKTSSREVKF